MATWSINSEKLLTKLIFRNNLKRLSCTRYKKICYNMDIMWQTACLIVYPIMVYNFAFLFTCMTVGRSQTKWRLSPQSVSDGCRLTMNVCGRTHRGLVCGFLVFWIHIASEPFALFHQSVCDYMCFTVTVHR